MELGRTIAKKRLTVLGLNSGTSVDSLDLAVVKVVHTGGRLKTEFLAGRGKPFPAELRQSLLKIAESEPVNLNDIIDERLLDWANIGMIMEALYEA